MGAKRDIVFACLRFWGWFFLYLVVLSVPAAFVGLALRGAIGSTADTPSARDFELVVDDPMMIPLGLASLAAALLATRWSRRKEQLSAFTVGLGRKRMAPDFFLGLGIGLASFMLFLLTAATGGWVSVHGVSAWPSVFISFVVAALALLPAAATEEIATRGVPLALLGRWSWMVAILVTAVAFALPHLANPGANAIAFLDTVVAGIALAVGRLRSGALWLPIGWHFGWNFAMGWLFGCPVSGSKPAIAPLFAVQVDGPAHLVGGSFGPESGLLAVGADLVVLALFWRFYPARVLSPDGDALSSMVSDGDPRPQ